MSIDPKFVELTADVLDFFFIKYVYLFFYDTAIVFSRTSSKKFVP